MVNGANIEERCARIPYRHNLHPVVVGNEEKLRAGGHALDGCVGDNLTVRPDRRIPTRNDDARAVDVEWMTNAKIGAGVAQA